MSGTMSEGEYQESCSDPEPEYDSHAVRDAIYAMTQAGDFWPSLSCDCGFTATAKTWEEAGALYDKHLEGNS